MKTEERTMIRQRIQSRMKGLRALLLIVIMVVGVMPSMGTEAASSGDNFYLIKYTNINDAFLGSGRETIDNVTPFKNLKDTGFANGYIKVVNGIIETDASSPLTKIGDIGHADNSKKVSITVPEGGAVFYFGGCIDSGAWITVNLDGEEKGTSGAPRGVGGDSTKESFRIEPGKYSVQHTGTVSATNSPKWIVDIETLISSISLSATTLDFTVGDAAKSLTVEPSTAEVTWSSDKESVAKVDDNGKVTPVGAGTATITATLKDDVSVKATCAVTVNQKAEQPALEPQTESSQVQQSQTSEEKITISKRPIIKKPKAKKIRATVSWQKLKRKTKKQKKVWKQIKQIEVQWSTDPSFPKELTNKKTIGKRKTKTNITGLQRKTLYFVRVRYCDGNDGYSRWSKTKRFRTK